MRTLNYLNAFFYTQQELLAGAEVTESELHHLQKTGVMPSASYQLKLDLNAQSYLGVHDESLCVDYYAKGYVYWLGIVAANKKEREVYSLFSNQYEKTIEYLMAKGFITNNPNFNADLSMNIESDWQHFLNGVYGLCTKSRLPKDIASKELASAVITELDEKQDLSDSDLIRLKRAVNLLDKSSSQFAPHERAACSRERLVNHIRLKYKIPE